MGNPKQEGIEWFAISVNNLQSAIGNPRAGFERKPEDEYLWLLKEKDPHTPNARAGTSIFIYHLK
ncbi:TPA: hypothetical protein DIS57_00630 [Candidatus Wolfebacteria bacterium]|nr:hypothetical protein [Candidatus Wolfebacteria bacterium]